MSYETFAIRNARSEAWGAPQDFNWRGLIQEVDNLPEGGQILLRGEDTLILEKQGGTINEVAVPY